jgi:hypothetical protein
MLVAKGKQQLHHRFGLVQLALIQGYSGQGLQRQLGWYHRVAEFFLSMNHIRIALCCSAVAMGMFFADEGGVRGAAVLGVILGLPQLVLLGLSFSSNSKIETVVIGSAIGLGIASLPGIGLVAIFAWLDREFGHRHPMAERSLILATLAYIWMIAAGIVMSKALDSRHSVTHWAILAPVISFIWVAFMFSQLVVKP